MAEGLEGEGSRARLDRRPGGEVMARKFRENERVSMEDQLAEIKQQWIAT